MRYAPLATATVVLALLSGACLDFARQDGDPSDALIAADALSDAQAGSGDTSGTGSTGGGVSGDANDADADVALDTAPAPDSEADAADTSAADTAGGGAGAADTTPEGCPDCAVVLGVIPQCAVAVLDPETCQCSLAFEGPLTPCNDWNPCTVEDHCVSVGTTSACVGAPLDPAVLCDDADPCTLETCDISIGCVHAPASGKVCDDGDPCTGGEVCEAGVCAPPTQFTCGSCSTVPGAPDTCETEHGDGDACNGTLTCDAGVCRVAPGTATECPTSTDPCVGWTCEVIDDTPTCVELLADDGKACTDGSVCTTNDACSGGVCTGLPSPLETCQCAEDADCIDLDDDDLCNGGHVCADGLCLYDPSTAVDCSHLAGGPCIVPSCDPVDGQCKAQALDDGHPCDDGDPCTIEDACQFGFCSQVTPLDCSGLDGPCAAGACDPELGCVAVPLDGTEGAPCQVADPCVAEAACNAGACIPLVAADCDDGDACTVDTCTPDGGCLSTGPTPPACPSEGVCAAGVPLACVGTSYVCDLHAVDGYSSLELCDELDNDCNGLADPDEPCSETLSCAVGELVKDYDGQMQACSVPDGVEFLGADLCGAGWTVCTHSQLLARLGPDTVPSGYWLAAAVSFNASKGTWASTDVMDTSCQEFAGSCGQTRTVQAVTWAGLFNGSLPHAAEAWGCAGDAPEASCASATALGVMCCAPQCAAGSCPDEDADPCTHESCLETIGECQVSPAAPPTGCPSKGVCAAGVPTVCGEDGELHCASDALPGFQPVEGLCDGLDNDCDGLTDAFDGDLLAALPACKLQLGVCEGSTRTLGHCQAGAWQVCKPKDYTAQAPEGEVYEADSELSCDGVDNDCDGATDESFAFEGLKVGEVCPGVGECPDGVVTCGIGGEPASCSTLPGGVDYDDSRVELCNGLDDDCDGETDEPEGLDPDAAGCPALGVCGALAPVCDAGGWSCPTEALPAYEAFEVSCDGLDNDCDGATDEELAWLGTGEAKAKGEACGTELCPGTAVCSGDLTGLVCNAGDSSGVEICDNVDNDCDQAIDEGMEWQGIALGGECGGLGACSAQVGVVQCNAAGAAICSLMPGGLASNGAQELCDGIDNDCDGLTDEGITYFGAALGQPCDGVGECGSGTVECGAGATAICSTDPGGSAPGAVAELCNNKDDDCDGKIDEGSDLGVAKSDCHLQGVCTLNNVSGKCVGGTWTCNYSGVSGYQEGHEGGHCDGLDNDCDGATDEDFADLGAACDGDDPDLCATGVFACAASGLGLVCEDDAPRAEQCDGGLTDEDCDGLTDEAGSAGCLSFWFDGDGDGYGTGSAQCLCAANGPGDIDAPQAGDCADGNGQVNPGADELCNGLDDDCDGLTDSSDPVDLLAGDAHYCESTQGVCAGVIKPGALCAGGTWQPCQGFHYADARPAFQASHETSCDGLDNDCDGLTDEDLGGSAPLCAKQSGVCQGAVIPADHCVGGSWTACGVTDYTSHHPAFETDEVSCDGLDNDCDGLTDEGFAWLGSPVGAACDGIGVCGTGVVECTDDATAATCSTNPNGSNPGGTAGEVCNGKDDDCDGLTDEGVPASQSPCFFVGVCTTGNVVATCSAGSWLCDYSGVQHYESLAEVSCDGLDNDCDGLTDNDFTWLDSDGSLKAKGASCGSDACAGVVVCDTSGTDVTCSSAGGDVELCDGVDNDCDGLTDEGLVYNNPDGGPPAGVGEACQGAGVCGEGVVICTAGLQIACSSISQAQAETCNHLDDDCDGATDEGFQYNGKGIGLACDGIGACAAGLVECRADGTAATCSTNPDGGASGAVAETCDQQDNDCDGSTDEGLGWSQSTCAKTGVCTSANTVAQCNGGAWSCTYNSPHYDPADDESGDCDDRDNDCDGTTDESWPAKGQACDGPDPDQCALGALQCPIVSDPSGVPGGSLSCQGDVPKTETCGDGLDNDCDSFTDEDDALGCVTWFADTDHDSYGDPDDSVCRCAGQPQGDYTANNGDDCQPQWPQAHPAADEYCDAWDLNCDGSPTAGSLDCIDFWYDEDGDGYGVGDPVCLCAPDGFLRATEPGDCNDIVFEVNPSATETCDEVDLDCDGLFFVENTSGCEPWFFDGDGDGYAAKGAEERCYCDATGAFSTQQSGDCCDTDAGSKPSNGVGFKDHANGCESWDWNCDGLNEQQWTAKGACDCKQGDIVDCDHCQASQGWSGTVQWWVLTVSEIGIPACGQTDQWLDSCSPEDMPGDKDWKVCETQSSLRTQKCR